MRVIYTHIYRIFIRAVSYTVGFIIGIVLINLILGLTLYCLFPNGDVVSSVLCSTIVFYGMSDGSVTLPDWWVILEQVVRDCYVVFIAGVIFYKATCPICPVYFCKYFTVDERHEVFCFRYWILKKKNDFSYDLNIRVYVEDKENYSGKNRVQTVWEWKSEDQNLEMARGVRYIEFMDKKAYRKAQCRVANKNLYKLLEENYKITIIISGTDESGRKFYGVKRYGMDNCAVGYKFLSIQRTWFSKELSLDAKDLKGIPITRFQNFDKLYKPGMKDGVNVDEVIYPKNPDEKDIVDKKKAKKVTLTDFISAFFAESLSSQRRKKR